MRPVATDGVVWSACLLSPAKTAQPIKMPFGELTRSGQRNRVLDKGRDTAREGKFFDLSGPLKVLGVSAAGFTQQKINDIDSGTAAAATGRNTADWSTSQYIVPPVKNPSPAMRPFVEIRRPLVFFDADASTDLL